MYMYMHREREGEREREGPRSAADPGGQFKL